MTDTTSWATTQLSRLLDLDNDSLKQIIDYSNSISKEAAAEHLKDILGDSPRALEFITSYNARRGDVPGATNKNASSQGPTMAAAAASSPAGTPGSGSPYASGSELPKRTPRKKNQKAPLNHLPAPRRPEDYGNVQGAYRKQDEQDYMPGSSQQQQQRLGNHKNASTSSNAFSLSAQPTFTAAPVRSSSPATKSSRLPPSASGSLISDLPNVRQTTASPKPTSTPASRTASPAPAKSTKIHLTGGQAMHGSSTVLSDLDSAIRALEIQTNPTLSAADAATINPAARRCTCMATRHPLLAAAPNCVNCGKIICVKEGIGPCTFCSAPLLNPEEIQAMLSALKEERGKERMSVNNAAHKRADISGPSRPFQTPPPPSHPSTPPSQIAASATTASENEALQRAQAHKDRLLTFQSQNAKRTHVIDEAADFETPTSGQSMWASPTQRAEQLKRQQRVLREQEWNAKPEYEKRRVVVSLDVVGGKVVKRMGTARNEAKDVMIGDSNAGDRDAEEGGVMLGGDHGAQQKDGKGTGLFGRNPLLGGLIKPKWEPKGKKGENGEAEDKMDATDDENKENRARRTTTWRRVQDDNDDNEDLILDGGVYGGQNPGERRLGGEERAVGM
ncbi:hypothetical protein MMC25_004028 [Agyrium rufum]|nr:hypothetical protein [Agyrium rufum]